MLVLLGSIGTRSARADAPGADQADKLAAAIAEAEAHLDARNGDGAAVAAERIVAMRGLAADWYYLAWIQARLQKKHAAACESAAKALEIDAQHLSARLLAIDLLLAAGNHAQALPLAQKGVTLHPTEARMFLRLALVHVAGKRSGAAGTAIESAHRLAAGQAGMLAAVASVFSDLKQADRAAEVYAQALAADPNHAGALLGAATMALQREDLGQAEAYLKRAEKLPQTDGQTAFVHGLLAQKRSQWPAAVAAFKRAFDLEPDNVQFAEALAMAQVQRKALSAAVSTLKKAIALAPDDAWLHLQLGLAYLDLRSFAQARDEFVAAATNAPKDPQPHYYLAIVLGDRLGKNKEALAALEQYAALGGKNKQALEWLADLREKFGK